MQRVYYLDLVLVPLVCITYYLFFITYYLFFITYYLFFITYYFNYSHSL